MAYLITSLRLCGITLLICVGAYTAIVLGFARFVSSETANGSLLVGSDGTTVVGSRLLAQGFTQPRYFWPRPSAVGYNAAGAGGSNKSPTSPDLAERAKQAVAAHGATPARPLPADLAAASGCGLDPHITERAALWQIERVAGARARSPQDLVALVRQHAFATGFLGQERLVNVLELNLALDRP